MNGRHRIEKDPVGNDEAGHSGLNDALAAAFSGVKTPTDNLQTIPSLADSDDGLDEGDGEEPDLLRDSQSTSPSPSPTHSQSPLGQNKRMSSALSPPVSPMAVPPPLPPARPYGSSNNIGIISLPPVDPEIERKIQSQMERNQQLRESIARIRQRRQCVEAHQSTIDDHLSKLQNNLTRKELERDRAITKLEKIRNQLRTTESRLKMAQRWNVTNDCFFIWHHGPFCTINGLRLGSEAPVVTNTIGANRTPVNVIPLRNAKNQMNQTQNGYIQRQYPGRSITPPPPPLVISPQASPQNETRRYLPFSLSFVSVPASADTTAISNGLGDSISSINTTNPHGNNNAPNQNVTVITQKVPWAEINSALGQIALLLTCFAERSGITYANVLHPMGSTSKIGIRANGGTQVPVLYNLWSSDDGFSLILFNNKQRNFTIAIQGLAQCVADAGRAILRRDPTLALPYPIAVTTESNDVTIGDMSIGTTSNVEWTQAMKNLLIDIKWLVAYAAKHVDR